jgi:hypothetical protein
VGGWGLGGREEGETGYRGGRERAEGARDGAGGMQRVDGRLGWKWEGRREWMGGEEVKEPTLPSQYQLQISSNKA